MTVSRAYRLANRYEKPVYEFRVMFLALPVMAQGEPQPFSKSYSDISTEQAWNAAAVAVQELPRNLVKKGDVSRETLEFAQYSAGIPVGKAVRFKVAVTQIDGGRIQVTVIPLLG